MPRAQQLQFSIKDLNLKVFGGDHLKGNAKFARPISVKRPMHLVMRSTMATKRLSFLIPVRAKRIEHTIRSQALKTGVRLYRYANAGNHLHIVIKVNSRAGFRSFIRAVSGLIARITLSIERGNAMTSGKVKSSSTRKFWDARPFTRILEWGKEYSSVCHYVLQNTLEALGFIAYQPRKKFVAGP